MSERADGTPSLCHDIMAGQPDILDFFGNFWKWSLFKVNSGFGVVNSGNC